MGVTLALQGACGSCPSSTVTMKMGIERVLRENWPNLGAVMQVKGPPEVQLADALPAIIARLRREVPPVAHTAHALISE